MPASFTHQCFGDDVLPHLSTHLQELITSHKEYYDIGLQGPDIFFYFHPIRKSMIRDYGVKLHKQSAYPFFEEIISVLHFNQDPRAIAYILGFMNHYLLDSELHPLINKTGKHFACERDLDHYFIKKRKPKNKSVADHFSTNEEICKVIGHLLHVEPVIIKKAISSFKFYGALLYNDHQPILKSTKCLLKTFKIKYADMIMTGPYTTQLDEIIKQYHNCINVNILEDVYLAIIHGNSLSSRFTTNYYGET